MNLPEPIGEAALAFFQKLLGPVAEAGEILSDKIRFYRWRSSLKTMQRAKEIAEREGLRVEEIPLKFLIPFMEKSSLEDEDSPLIERWAMLLAQVADNPERAQAAFVEILSRLSASEVGALERIIPTAVFDGINNQSHEIYLNARIIIRLLVDHDALYNRIYSRLGEICDSLPKSDYRANLQSYLWGLTDPKNKPFVEVVTARFHPFAGDDIFKYNENFDNSSVLDVLFSCGLISRRQSRFEIPDGEVFVTVINPTPLGVRFVAACRGDALIESS